jgi:hypothetical protein
MKNPIYYLSWNRKTFEYFCDGKSESNASYRRHLAKVISHYQTGDENWVTLIKDNRVEPISQWQN